MDVTKANYVIWDQPIEKLCENIALGSFKLVTNPDFEDLTL
jgi:hypothetical protein